LFEIFFLIDNSFDESFYYFKIGFVLFNSPLMSVPLTDNIMSNEVLFNTFYIIGGYTKFYDFLSRTHIMPILLKGIFSFRLALIFN